MGAALRVSHLWRSCARDSALPFWAHLSAERFNAVHAWSAEAPRFCACAVLEVLHSGVGRRLRRLDLSGVTTCDRCSYEDTGSISGRPADATRKANELLRALFAAGRDALGPEELHLLRDIGREFSVLFSVDFWSVLPLEKLPRAQLATLPRLRVLRIHGNARVTAETSILRSFLERLPALEELYAADVGRVLGSYIPRPLRIQTLNREPLPRAFDVACGVCGALLWRRLTQFMLAPPFQVQQAAALYTNVPPDRDDIASMGHEAMIICRNRCHATLRYYLADGGTFWVDRLRWRYVIAVGPASIGGDGLPSPPLTTLTPLD